MRIARLLLLSLLALGCDQTGGPGPGPGPTPDAGTAEPDAGLPALCGNGALDPAEHCDPAVDEGAGACPARCEDDDPCTTDRLTGTSAACTARCEHLAVTACADGDGCCPAGCDGDGDCTACQQECTTADAVRCEGDAVVRCGQFDPDACLEWSAAAPCPDGQSCNAGLCEDVCVPDCTTAGARRCDEAGAIVVCEERGGCLKWSAPTSCPSPQVCAAGECALACEDECQPRDARRCVAGTSLRYESCGDHDLDGCLEWGAAQNCGAGLVCAEGACQSSCQNGCTAAGDRKCQNEAVVVCGDYNSDACLEWGTESPCASYESCAAGACQPKPVPGKVVINEVVYDSAGADTEAFVELFGPAGLNLAGFSLVGVNGNGGASYNGFALVGSIGADGYYVIARPDASAALRAQTDQLEPEVDFQNGPDSIQLLWGQTAVDALGYGSFGAADVFAGEGQPAGGAAEGHSLGRAADHADTDDNRADFADRASPTPGAANPAPGPVCGNGQLEAGERCDGDCPTSCDDLDACTVDRLVGSAAGCDARCEAEPISACGAAEGCCPAGCDATSDPDCSASCGNGVVEGGELCDGNCPSAASCEDGEACTLNWLDGSATTCDATCASSSIATCRNADGCCAPGCNANTDDDCAAVCGNGVTEPGEKCDASCPTNCDDGYYCTQDTLTGSACTSVCTYGPITQCQSGDGCCPAGCALQGDSDCPATCQLGASVAVSGLSSVDEEGLSVLPTASGFAVASGGGANVRFDLLSPSGASLAGNVITNCGRASCAVSLAMTADQFAVAYAHRGPGTYGVPGSEDHVSLRRFALDGTPVPVTDARLAWGTDPLTLLQRPAGGTDFMLGFFTLRPNWVRVTAEGAAVGVPWENTTFLWTGMGPAMTNAGTGYAMAVRGEYSSAGSTKYDIEFFKTDSTGKRTSGKMIGLPSEWPAPVLNGRVHIFQVASNPVRYGLFFEASASGVASVFYARLDSTGTLLELTRLQPTSPNLRLGSVFHEQERSRFGVILTSPNLPAADPQRHTLQWFDTNGVALGRTVNLGALTGRIARHPSDGVYRLFSVGTPMTVTPLSCP